LLAGPRILLHAASTISTELLYREEREREREREREGERDLDSRNFLCWPVHGESKIAQALDQVYRQQRPARLRFNSNSAKFFFMAITRVCNFYVSHHAFCIEPF
jgi:hypothetical protein